MENTERLIAKDLLSIGAVFLRPEEPFTWASGIKSPIYCDNRLTLTAPKVRDDVENALAEVVKTHYPECEVLMENKHSRYRSCGYNRTHTRNAYGLCAFGQ